AEQVNTLMVDAKGRNMKCLTFFLMLPESVKIRSKKSNKKGSPTISKVPPVCYEIITLKTKKKKMAAEIFPTRKPTSTTTVQNYHQQNLNNNNAIPAPNWQGLYPTIRERNAVMFNNDLMADVHFVVGPPGGTQRLPGHRYVLAVGSSVFHAMFYGELAEDKDEIRIPDVEPAAFLAMLKLQLEIFEGTGYLKTGIDPFVVFEAALSWAEVECQRQEMTVTIDNKRKVLGKAVYLIRIPTMALDDFANGAAQSGVLTLNETNDIFLIAALAFHSIRYDWVGLASLHSSDHYWSSCRQVLSKTSQSGPLSTGFSNWVRSIAKFSG
ncbi:UNVERIFIED_CONTAM: hypothetical protein FKN15_030459, partial [Acipenser sinensis]